MKKDTVTVSMDAEKLRAIKRYMSKKDADLEVELCDQLQRLYEKYVPGSVREYIDESAGNGFAATDPAKKQKEKSRTSTVHDEQPPTA